MAKYTFFFNIRYISIDFERILQKKYWQKIFCSHFGSACFSCCLILVVFPGLLPAQVAPATGIPERALKKIPLDSNMIIDFSGAWGRAAYSSFNYFDSKADPVHHNFSPDSTSGNTSIGGEGY